VTLRVYGRLSRGVGFSAPVRGRGCLIVLAYLVALSCPNHVKGQTPNAIVDVELAGTGLATTVEAVVTADSTLLLPAADVAAFLGIARPTTPWLTPADITRAYPTVTVTFVPRLGRVVVSDPAGALPASRAFAARIEREGRNAPPLTVVQSGPFLAVAADNTAVGNTRVDAGYSWRGKLAVALARSSTTGAAWSVGVAPSPVVFLTYSGGRSQPAAVSGRLAKGPLWVAPAWSATDRALRVDGLVAVGRVAVFASTRRTYVVTIHGPGGDLQVGRSAGVTAARFSVGPIPASPFSFPITH